MKTYACRGFGCGRTLEEGEECPMSELGNYMTTEITITKEWLERLNELVTELANEKNPVLRDGLVSHIYGYVRGMHDVLNRMEVRKYEKNETLPRIIKTDFLVNKCRKCFAPITLQRYVGVDEGSNQLNGWKLNIGFCQNDCPNVFYIPPRKDKLDGDYRIIKVD